MLHEPANQGGGSGDKLSEQLAGALADRCLPPGKLLSTVVNKICRELLGHLGAARTLRTQVLIQV
jgi:hypothetical protein